MTAFTLTGAQASRPAHAITNQAAPSVNFLRLAYVEARKLVDTRAARWLIIATIILSGVIVGILLALPRDADIPAPSVTDLISTGTMALHMLFPIMAIMLAAGEWTQHGAVVTFTVEPRRLRVIAAKIVAVTLASVAIFLLMGLATVAVAGVASAAGANVIWTINASQIAWVGVTCVLSALTGLGLGLLLMNTAGAIVFYFVVPTLMQLVGGFWERASEIVQWLTPDTAFAPLTMGVGDLHWGKIATATAFWVVLPLVAGAVRTVRREVK